MSKKEDNTDALATLDSMFSLDEKIEAMEILMDSNYSYSATAKKIGVDERTLKNWAVRLMPLLNKNADRINDIIESREDDLEVQFDRVVKEARVLALEQLRIQLPKEENIDRITRALKTLHEITNGEWSLPNSAGSPKAGSYYQQINNYILNQKNENSNDKKE